MNDRLTKKEIVMITIVGLMLLSSFIWSLMGAYDIGKLEYSVGKLEKALLEKCDTWNIAIAREQADGSIEPQYIRICQEDYETFSRLISK